MARPVGSDDNDPDLVAAWHLEDVEDQDQAVPQATVACTVLHPFQVWTKDSGPVGPGGMVDLDIDEASRLVASGLVERAAASSTKPAT